MIVEEEGFGGSHGQQILACESFGVTWGGEVGKV